MIDRRVGDLAMFKVIFPSFLLFFFEIFCFFPNAFFQMGCTPRASARPQFSCSCCGLSCSCCGRLHATRVGGLGMFMALFPPFFSRFFWVGVCACVIICVDVCMRKQMQVCMCVCVRGKTGMSVYEQRNVGLYSHTKCNSCSCCGP